MKRNLVLSAALALAAAHPAAAQLRIPPVQLIAGVGEVGATYYGAYHGGSAVYDLTHHAARAWRLGLETPSPVRGVDLRLNLQRWSPRLTVSSITPGAAPVLPTGEIQRTTVTALTLDAVIRLPRVLESRPYVLLGTGLTRYDFNERYYQSAGQVALGDRTRPTAHLGLGTAWSVGRYDLFVEGSTFTTRLERTTVDQRLDLHEGHNANFTVGVRIPLHR